MSLALYIDGPAPRRKRFGPLGTSAAIHGFAFLALMHAPEIRLPEQAQSEYSQAIAGNEHKLVWYRFKDLPNVTPPQAKPDRRPLRAEFRAKQEIVASRKDAPKRPQMVWTPAPELRRPTPVKLPNILAVAMPQVAKPFVAPPVRAKPVEAKIELAANAPVLDAPAFDPLKLPDAPKVTKRFVPPPRRVPEKITEVVHVDSAPQIDAGENAAVELNYAVKAPTRPFTAPPANKAAQPGKTVEMAGSAPDITGASSQNLNLAAVGLNPVNVPVALPETSSPGQFSAGPKIRLDGADAAGQGKGLNVPDLFVRGAREAKPDLIAQAFAAPTSALTLQAAARGVVPKTDAEPSTHSESINGAVKVSSAPGLRFLGRDVFMMAIQMPNLTSSSGSWLMWYADRTAREAGLAPVSPPIAHRKVDPKYIASAADEHIEGKVQLECVIDKQGRVTGVELVRGLDDRLNQSAEEALAKWEFTPATRHGEPVDVDVLVEIPFTLAHPVVAKPYTQ